MTTPLRIIDLMCDWHRTLILDTRLWPAGYTPGNHDRDGNNSCHDCGLVGSRKPSGRWEPLPHLDAREVAAVHEAGHAVAYQVQGVPVVYAALEPGREPGSNAHIAIDFHPHQRGSDVELAGLWAGHAAELRWLARDGRLDDAAAIDLVATSSLDGVMLVATGRCAGDIQAARHRADQLVGRHWDAIERVADALLAQGRLDGEEIARLAGPVTTLTGRG